MVWVVLKCELMNERILAECRSLTCRRKFFAAFFCPFGWLAVLTTRHVCITTRDKKQHILLLASKSEKDILNLLSKQTKTISQKASTPFSTSLSEGSQIFTKLSQEVNWSNVYSEMAKRAIQANDINKMTSNVLGYAFQ